MKTNKINEKLINTTYINTIIINPNVIFNQIFDQNLFLSATSRYLYSSLDAKKHVFEKRNGQKITLTFEILK